MYSECTMYVLKKFLPLPSTPATSNISFQNWSLYTGLCILKTEDDYDFLVGNLLTILSIKSTLKRGGRSSEVRV